MTLEILKYPHPALKKRAAEVKQITPEIEKLLSDMVETMRSARGVGLAATQVGVDKRVIVLEVPEGGESAFFKLINPEIVSREGGVLHEEGCLSIPGVTAEVARSESVVVRALDEKGRKVEIEGRGLLAIAFQHEVDHIDGVLFVDRLSRLKRGLVLRKYKKERAAATGGL
jgi:peptide deformylase